MAKDVKSKEKTQQKKKKHNGPVLTRDQQETYNDLLSLRKAGIITRHHFRLMCWDKGLNRGTYCGGQSPEYTAYHVVKSDKGQTVVAQNERWDRWEHI